jgi:uncharacterized protein HemX
MQDVRQPTPSVMARATQQQRMEIFLIIGSTWLAVHIFGWWLQQTPPKTPEELLREQQEREQRERELRTRLEQQRIERERQEAERREEWHSAYGEYLRSDKWKQVHHVRYPKSFGRMSFKRENMSYLKVICRDCHRKQHGI